MLVSSGPLEGRAPGTNWDLVVMHSADGGKSWSGPVRVALGEGALIPAPGIFNDKPYIAAWGHGNAIVTWSQFHVGPGAIILSAPILASVTHDSGNTWTDPVQISGSLPFGEASVPVMAADGSIYVADTGNHTIGKITSDGMLSTLAGLPGTTGTEDGTGSAARFYLPIGLAVDNVGNV